MPATNPALPLENMFGLEGLLVGNNGRPVQGNLNLDDITQTWKEFYKEVTRPFDGYVDSYMAAQGYERRGKPDVELYGLSNKMGNAQAASIDMIAKDNRGRSKRINIVAGALLPFMLMGKSAPTIYAMVHEYLHKEYKIQGTSDNEALPERETYQALDAMFTGMADGSIKKPRGVSKRLAAELAYVAREANRQYQQNPYEAQTYVSNLAAGSGIKERGENGQKGNYSGNRLYAAIRNFFGNGRAYASARK